MHIVSLRRENENKNKGLQGKSFWLAEPTVEALESVALYCVRLCKVHNIMEVMYGEHGDGRNLDLMYTHTYVQKKKKPLTSLEGEGGEIAKACS